MEQKNLKAFLESDRDSLTDFTRDGACSHCGECCKDIILADYNELRKIKKYVERHKIKPQPHPLASNTVDMTCPFLNWDTRECAIYEVRPQICREFICSMTDAQSAELRDKMARKGTVMSLRKEVFGDDEHLVMAALSMTRGLGIRWPD